MPLALYGSLICVTLPFPIPLGRILLLVRLIVVAADIFIPFIVTGLEGVLSADGSAPCGSPAKDWTNVPMPFFPFPLPFLPFDDGTTGADVRTGRLVRGRRVLGSRVGLDDARVGGSVLTGLRVTGDRVGEQVDIFIIFIPFLPLPPFEDFEPFPEQAVMPIDGFCTGVRTGFFVGVLGFLVGIGPGGLFPTVSALGAWDPEGPSVGGAVGKVGNAVVPEMGMPVGERVFEEDGCDVGSFVVDVGEAVVGEVGVPVGAREGTCVGALVFGDDGAPVGS
jgi:hypothetical protein